MIPLQNLDTSVEVFDCSINFILKCLVVSLVNIVRESQIDV